MVENYIHASEEPLFSYPTSYPNKVCQWALMPFAQVLSSSNRPISLSYPNPIIISNPLVRKLFKLVVVVNKPLDR